jgi:hypothetical protein
MSLIRDEIVIFGFEFRFNLNTLMRCGVLELSSGLMVLMLMAKEVRSIHLAIPVAHSSLETLLLKRG